MRIDVPSLLTHMHVIGGTGVGKSRVMEGWIVQLAEQGFGVGVIDPHNQLIDGVLARLAKSDKQLAERVVLVDVTSGRTCVAINPLEIKKGVYPERQSTKLSDVVVRVSQSDPAVTVRMQRIMRHIFWLLILSNLTLVEFADVLLRPDLRKRLLAELPPHHQLRRYWESEFPANDPRLSREWAQSSLSRVDELASDPDIQLILGQQKSSIDFRNILDSGKILLVRLSKGVVPDKYTYLFGAFIVAMIQEAALSRGDTPGKKKPFFLFLDEFQNYLTDEVDTIITESRKYGLGLILAHQHLGQLRENNLQVLSAVLNTVQHRVVFRVGAEDAKELFKDMFAPPLDQVRQVQEHRLPTEHNLWYDRRYTFDFYPLDVIEAASQRELTGLDDRVFWYKQRGSMQPALHKARHLPDMDLTQDSQLREAVIAIKRASARRYGRFRDDVREEIEKRRESLLTPVETPKRSRSTSYAKPTQSKEVKPTTPPPSLPSQSIPFDWIVDDSE